MRALTLVAVLAACATPRSAPTEPEPGTAEYAALEARRAQESIEAAKAKGEAECVALDTAPVSEADEWKYGEDIATAIAWGGRAHGATATRPPDPRPDLAAYLTSVGNSLAAASARPALVWTFQVADPMREATRSAPGGWVFVSSEALAEIENEGELAALLAREVGHIAARHDDAPLMKARANACRMTSVGRALTMAGAAAIPGGADFIASSSAFGGQSRDEMTVSGFVQGMGLREAAHDLDDDAEAIKLLGKAGYDLSALPAAISHVGGAGAAKRLEALATVKGKGKLPPFPKNVKLKK